MPTAFLRTTLILALGFVLSGRAAQPDQALSGTAEAGFTRALEIVQSARAGDKNAVEPAIAAFEALARSAPPQPVYAAHLGSALTLKGRDAWMPWSTIRHVEQGTDRIDAALAAVKPEHDHELLRGVPVSVETQFVAASTFIRIPDAIFHRRAEGKQLIAGLLGGGVLPRGAGGNRAGKAVDQPRREATAAGARCPRPFLSCFSTMTSAIPPSMATDASTRRRVSASPRNTMPPSAAMTGTLS